MGTHPIFESDFDCLTDEFVINANESGQSDSEINFNILSDTQFVFFKKSDSCVSETRYGKRSCFESAKQKRIYREASKHRPNPTSREVNRMAKYYGHHVVAREQWDYETNWTHMKRNILFDVRLQAAIKPYSNLDRKRVQNNLQMAGSALNPEILQNLALHEPETFKCLVEVAERFDHESVHAQNGTAEIPPNSLTNVQNIVKIRI